MSDCKQFEELLAVANELPAEESGALERHLADCGACRSRVSEYRTIMNALQGGRADPHPERELLARYVVQQSEPGDPDFDGRELTRAELETVGAHLERCETCREYKNAAIADYLEIDAYLQGQGLPESLPSVSRLSLFARVAAFWKGLRGYGTLVYASGAAMAVLLLWLSPLFRPNAEQYYALASFQDREVGVVTRTDGDELNQGLAAFTQERYRDAIETLETYVGQLPENTEAPYARYVLGLCYLHAARSDFLGRAHRVDAHLVERGLAELFEAERATESRRVREDAQWFLANGYLLQLDIEAALESLEKVEALNGRRSSEAHALAEEIRAVRNASR